MKIPAINSIYGINPTKVKENKTLKSNSIKEHTELSNNYYQPLNLANQYPNAIPFKGINAKGVVKQRGIFMHITSLPGTRSFCGQFGDIQTTKFINWLAAAKQTHWIMNPLNALEDHLCPYSAAGRYSRNLLLTSIN